MKQLKLGPLEVRFSRARPATPTTIAPRSRPSLPSPGDAPAHLADLIRRVRDRGDWYHSIDLGEGIVTPGFVDHRDQVAHYGLPASLAGLRCLDVATFDGFWAFELERRGAAEVVAADIHDWTQTDAPRLMLRDPAGFGLEQTTGDGFALAHERLGSRVERIERSVYDLDPAEVGTFDLVFISDLLVHLRDPQLALERAWSVCRGTLVLADVYSPALDELELDVMQLLAPGETWWIPNVRCMKRMLMVAGFEDVEEVARFQLDATPTRAINKVVLHARAAASPAWAERERVRRQAASPS